MAAGDPTGADLASGTTAGDGLPEFPTETQNTKITFGAGTALTSGVKYAIVVRSAGVGSSNRGVWQMKTTGEKANGQRLTSTDSGSSWSGDAADCWFKTYTGPGFNILRDSYNPVWEGAAAEYYDTQWTAQTFTATSSYTITAVNLELGRASGASPGTITVSIKAVESGAPSKAINPAPTDAASGILLGLGILTWEDGGDSETYDVYFGKTGEMVKVHSAQSGLLYSIGTLDYNAEYSWRIDSTNENGTTTGDVWTYTCIDFSPPLPSGVTLTGSGGPHGEGTPTGTPSGLNNMMTIRKLVAVAENRFWIESV